MQLFGEIAAVKRKSLANYSHRGFSSAIAPNLADAVSKRPCFAGRYNIESFGSIYDIRRTTDRLAWVLPNEQV